MSDVKKATAESILAFRDKVPVKEFELGDAGIIFIHGFTGLDKARWQRECRDKDGSVNPELVEPLMFQMCVKDEAGKQLYKFEDIPKLKLLPASVLSSVTDICMKLSGMGPNADAEILRNFEATQTEGS